MIIQWSETFNYRAIKFPDIWPDRWFLEGPELEVSQPVIFTFSREHLLCAKWLRIPNQNSETRFVQWNRDLLSPNDLWENCFQKSKDEIGDKKYGEYLDIFVPLIMNHIRNSRPFKYYWWKKNRNLFPTLWCAAHLPRSNSKLLLKIFRRDVARSS